MSTTCSSGVCVLVRSPHFVSFRTFLSHSLFFSSTSAQYHHQCQYQPFTLRSCKTTGSSLCSIVVASLIYSRFQHLSIFTIFLRNPPFYLQRITWASVAATIGIYAISGIDWFVKLMDGWTNRLNKYGSIYAGLRDERWTFDEVFRVSAVKTVVLIDKGREDL